MARAAGLIPEDVVDERYGMTVDEWLVDRRVIQGLKSTVNIPTLMENPVP